MAELMEKEQQTVPAETPVSHENPPGSPPPPKNLTMAKKKRRRLIRRIIILLILIAAAILAWKYFGKDESSGEGEVVVDTVRYDSITSVIENSGLTKLRTAKPSRLPPQVPSWMSLLLKVRW